MSNFIQITTLQYATPTRTETLEGRRYLVAPVVLLVEGVHAGSRGPVYYPPSVLAKFPASWNGAPLPVFHPKQDGEPVSANAPAVIERQCVGQLFNVFFDSDGNRLRGEVWIDEGKAQRISQDVLSLIRSGGRLEISTGLWTEDDNTPGTWNGESYEATITDYRPDHLALLPGGEGACNWSDGCGVRVNNPKQTEVKVENGKKSVWQRLQDLVGDVGRGLGFVSQETSHEELRSKIQRVLDALDNDGWLHFIRDVYDDVVVYEARGSNPNEVGSSVPVVKLYKRAYTESDEGEVTLDDNAQEVREVREYVPVSANVSLNVVTTNNDDGWYGNTITTTGTVNEETKSKEKEATDMDKEVLINALIECDRTHFTEADKGWLETLEICRLETLRAVDAPPAVEEPEEEPPKEETTTEEPEGNEAPTVEEQIASLPPEVQETLTRAIERDKAIKDELVKGLLDNSQNKFTEDELREKDIKELEKLTDLGRIEVNYEGRVGGADTGTKKKGVPAMPQTFELNKGAA